MRRAWIAAAALALAACGDAGEPDAEQDASAQVAAERIKDAVDTVSKVVAVTEDNDPNNLIGRPTGYKAATVLYDERTDCADLGVECGATIEEFSTANEAQERSDYIQAALGAGGPAFGTEYHYLDGALLLRVSGALGPSEAEEYEAAFSS